MARERASMIPAEEAVLTITSRNRREKEAHDSNLLVLRKKQEVRRKFQSGNCRVCSSDRLLGLFKAVQEVVDQTSTQLKK